MADPAPPAAAPADAPAAAADGDAATYAPDADTWDHVVRAAAHCGQLEAAALLMRATREHTHDPELLARTRGVRGKRGLTLLMLAVMRCDVVRAAEIVGAAPTPAARAELLAYVDVGDFTALQSACSPTHSDEDAALALVELLLGAGADPLVRYRDPTTGLDYQPIHFAAHWSARLVQRLVQAGASIDSNVAGNSTLCCAARAGTARGVRMIPALVALGARETLGNRTIHVFACWPVEAAPPSDEEVRAALTALVSVGCSLTDPGEGSDLTPIDIAAIRGNAPVVRALLALGVAATTKSLAHAAEHPEIVRLLLAAGAPPGGLVRGVAESTVSPLMAAAALASLESVRLLLAAGATFLQRNERGHTALMYALRSGATDAAAVPHVVEALLIAGSDVAARDRDGNTPLHLLALHCAMQPWAAAVARLLLGNGADVDATNKAGLKPAGCVPDAGEGRAAARDELVALLLEAEGGEA